jgi:hypothetical protein
MISPIALPVLFTHNYRVTEAQPISLSGGHGSHSVLSLSFLRFRVVTQKLVGNRSNPVTVHGDRAVERNTYNFVPSLVSSSQPCFDLFH